MKFIYAFGFVLACANARPHLRWLAEETNSTATHHAGHRNSTEAAHHNTTQSAEAQSADQRNQTAPSTAQSQNATAESSNSSVVACKSTFPEANAPQDWLKSSNFEEQKNSTWLRYTVAQLAPCLIKEGQCQSSLSEVNKLAGALGSVTQQLHQSQDWGGNSTKFAEAVKSYNGEKVAVNQSAPCVLTQEGGLDGFLDKYSEKVKDWSS